MAHLKSLWVFSGKLPKREYVKILTVIHGAFLIFYAGWLLLDSVARDFILLTHLNVARFREYLPHYLWLTVFALILLLVILPVNIRFFPFVQAWIAKGTFRKPNTLAAIQEIKDAYHEGYQRAPVRTEYKVNGKFTYGVFDRTPNGINGTVEQYTTQDSRVASGLDRATTDALGRGGQYMFQLILGTVFLLMFSWYLSFILGWFAIDSLEHTIDQQG
ncbi:hypothetical protein [Lacticaseibacillus nasuensis]|uniref:Uncharacterized protein n=1 Tax=Lacticaseibacillus nasuensis JCM 17158 TaxID=1291734 RepID=A0A0R1K061_9LACO|nr:hypothetical protein [Lacticaseibacillus nasuensis]KRK74033.1 hypothetical protein FD02_GL001871 [Lacticaseibacillus nasuensis JCM 17158]